MLINQTEELLFEPELSIITVNWNSNELVIELLKQIKNTTKNIYEVIITDNGSSIEDRRKLEEYCSQYFNIKLIYLSTNTGFSYANNCALKLAKGKYICLLNSDVRLEEKDWDEQLI